MYLLDTNVISELRKVQSGKANEGVADWARNVSIDMLFISAVSVHELELGVRLRERADPGSGGMLRAWLDQQVLPAFHGRILAVDEAVARVSAQWHVPDPRPLADSLIAATAKVHGHIVVTRNVRDFERFGLQLLNPWR